MARPARPADDITPNRVPPEDLDGHHEDGPSDTIARYLEAMFYIDGEGEVVRAARLAEWLAVSQPTVAAALRRMARDGLIDSAPTKELSLTAKGRVAAAEIVRKHRIAERWLVDALGFDWLPADEEASRLEHGLSLRVADRLHELIGRPRTCPHGNPIPGVPEDGKRERSLASLQPGDRAPLRRISEVAEHEVPDLLRFLGNHGFALGGVIEMVEFSKGAGTITVQVAGRRVSMSTDVAGKIWVEA